MRSTESATSTLYQASAAQEASAFTQQAPPPPLSPSARTQYSWLTIYFFLNIALTIFNKVVLGKFPFPYTLTAVHAFSGTVGCFVLLRMGFFKLSRLTTSENMILVLFSFLFTINIAISNVSLGLVTVPLHQIIRATTPLFAITMNVFLDEAKYSFYTYMSLLLVVAGVGFSTFGDYYCTPLGFVLTLLGAFLAAVKTVVANKMLTGRLRLGPLELLYRMLPLAFIQTIVYGYVSGEIPTIMRAANFASDLMPLTPRADSPNFVLDNMMIIKLALNGLIAFALNIVSFTANKNTSALTMTVAGNVKQVTTIVLSIVFFNLAVNLVNAFGIALTFAGGAWYAKVELDRKQASGPVATGLPKKDDLEKQLKATDAKK